MRTSACPGTRLDTMRLQAPIRHRARNVERFSRVPPDTPAPRVGLGLTASDLEEALLAVGDREDHVGTDGRARLARVRAALERELLRQ